jgi:CRP-like cAMP-binding protein
MSDIYIFRNATDTISFGAGETIFNAGEKAEAMYGVVEGEIDIHRDGKPIETVGPGGIFGEMALIDHSLRSASATAKTDCKVVMVDERRFVFMVQETPYFALDVMRVLVERIRKYMDK